MMKKNIFKLGFVLFPIALSAQDNDMKLSSYITPYVGVNFQGSLNTEQTGTAHKRGNYNAFDTDFDLLVDVKGKSKNSSGATFGVTYGNLWTKKDRKWNPGFEIDVFHTNGKHESKLANPYNEEVANISGSNLDSVVALVEEHYGAGHHEFSNTMTMSTWNAAGNFTLSFALSSKISINTALGLGFSAVTLKDAKSLQTSPAAATPGYETTNDNGGGPVNHFNTQPNASNNLMFGQFRVGTRIQFAPKIALTIDVRGTYRGAGDFTFGSTKYTDHAPTDNWNYTIDKGVGYMLTTGLVKTL